jgi:phosphoribosylcarboxyaminoimidazole (NCAIR) mutase
MGSRSDWETMRHATETLDVLGVDYEVKVVSAHRTPDRSLLLAQAVPRTCREWLPQRLTCRCSAFPCNPKH